MDLVKLLQARWGKSDPFEKSSFKKSHQVVVCFSPSGLKHPFSFHVHANWGGIHMDSLGLNLT